MDLAENGDGRWKVSIQAIQCPVGNSKIEYRLEGSNDWYIKLQVRNERYLMIFFFCLSKFYPSIVRNYEFTVKPMLETTCIKQTAA